MNTSSEKILTDKKSKDYLINEGRIYIKLETDNIQKYEILIAKFLYESNHFVPELLFKYDSKISMTTDFDFLKIHDYNKFKKQQISSHGNYLIRKNTNDKIGKIYDLKAISPNNQTNKEYIKNNNNKNGPSANQLNNNNGNNSNIQSNEGNNQKPKENEVKKDLKSDYKSGQMNKITEPVLDEYKKYFVELLIRLFCFEKKISIKIKDPLGLNPSVEQGYIVNHKLIEIYKSWFLNDKLIPLLTKDKNFETIYNKYKNKDGYISETIIDEFLKEMMNFIPKEYINEVQKINNALFIAEAKSKKELYLQEKKDYGDYFDFSNCSIININLGKYFLFNIQGAQNLVDIFSQSIINFMIVREKLVIKFNLHIFIGYLDDKKIFNSEIIIRCSNENESVSLFNELKTKAIKDIIELTKRIDQNISSIGKYNNTNILVIILNEKYSLKKITSQQKEKTHYKKNGKNEKSDLNKEEKENTQINQSSLNKGYSYNNGIYPFPENLLESLNKTSFHNNKGTDSLLLTEEFQKTLKVIRAQPLNLKKENFLGIQNLQGQQLMNKIYEQQNKEKYDKQKEENDKKILEEQKMKEMMKKKNQIEKLIYLMIDLEKTNIKINLSLDKNTYYEKYYLINSDWFNEFSKNSQMNILFNNNIIFNSIKAVACNNFNMSNKNILDILKKDKTVEKEIDNISKSLQENNLPNKSQIEPQIGKTSLFNYYYNFVLISVEAINKLFKVDNKIPSLNCLFGDKSVFLLFNKNIITYEIKDNNEIKDNKYIPKLIFSFYDKGYLNETINLIKENHLENYKKIMLLQFLIKTIMK